MLKKPHYLVFLVLMAFPLSLRASAGIGPALAHASGVDGARNPSVFDPEPGGIDLESMRVGRTLKLTGRRLEAPVVPVSRILSGREPHRSRPNVKRRIALSVLASAILPGLGELYVYMGSREKTVLARTTAFFALEGLFWYGYDHNHSRGKDIKRRYMDYADEHWTEERFLAQHPCCAGLGGCRDYEEYNSYCKDHCAPPGCLYFLYIPRELDEEEYYENLGKYEAFVYGWDDWEEGMDGFWTPHRTRYVAMRDDSDVHLVKGDQYLMALLVNRVVSMIDAGWLAYRMNRGEVNSGGWSMELEPGTSKSTLALSYRF